MNGGVLDLSRNSVPTARFNAIFAVSGNSNRNPIWRITVERKQRRLPCIAPRDDVIRPLHLPAGSRAKVV